MARRPPDAAVLAAIRPRPHRGADDAMTLQPPTPSIPAGDSLGVQPWMAAPATRAVIAALEARGGAGCARFVGGCVRNTLVGRAVDDVDIATPLTPDEVAEALEA